MDDTQNTTVTLAGANVVRLKPSKRFTDRLDYGLTAAWKGQNLHLSNWSLGGLGVVYENCPWQNGQELKLLLHIPLKECHFPLTVRAVMTHYNQNTHHVGLKFSVMDAGTRAALTYVFRQQAKQEEVALADILAAYHQRQHQAQVSGEEGGDAPAFPQGNLFASVGRGTRYMAVAMLAVVVVYLLASMVHRNLFQIDAPYAALTAPAHTLTAPASGWLETLVPVKQGQQVRRGQPLVRLHDPAVEAQLATLDARIGLERDKQDILRQRLSMQRGMQRHYEKLASGRQQESQAGVNAARVRLTEAEKEFQRQEELFGKKLTTSQKRDAALAQRDAAKATLEAAQAASRVASTGQAMVHDDLYLSGNRVEGGNVPALQQDIAESQAVEKSLIQKKTALQTLSSRLTLTSPCDCIIGQTTLGNDAWVKSGQTLLALYPANSRTLTLEARVPQADASRLREGTRADVTLVSEEHSLRGVVKSIRRITASEPRLGLPAQADSTTWAAVTIALLEPLPRGAQAGLPAEVRFDLSYRNPLVKGYEAVDQWLDKTGQWARQVLDPV